MNEKISSKQWIPIYEIYRALKDRKEGKLSAISPKGEETGILYVHAIYHGIVLILPSLIGLEKILR